MANTNQIEILENIRHGNGDTALKQMYNHLLPKIRKYILNNSGTRDEANDIFQDAIIVFFYQVRDGKYDDRRNVEAYVFTVAKNLWIDKTRTKKRVVNYSHVGELEHIATEPNNQLHDMIDREKSSALKRVFEKLDPKCQKILHYYNYEKKSMKEIAVLMGYSSEDVAKTNHYRCKQYLAKLVKEDTELMELLRY
jgi:RNA polymerase sigma factor (sigma-70 family)